MIRLGMSTSCVYPYGVEHAFEVSKAVGFDGIEVLVTNDPITRDIAKLREYSERYEQPILAVHAPVLLLTTFVWGRDPRVKLEKSAELAAALDADTVVVHPPFRFQSSYATNFESIVREITAASGVTIAVENMFPWKIAKRSLKAYLPSSDPLALDVDAMTLDFSHASLSGRDSLAYAKEMGSRLSHIHLCDGSASIDEGMVFDEHLVPGRGTQPISETLDWLVENDWSGAIVAEINTRKERSDASRLALLSETVDFARTHLRRDPLSRGDIPPLKTTGERANRRSKR